MGQNTSNLIWIDLEMTGLDTQNDVIIEIATIVTDSELNILGEGPILAIHQSDQLLAGMDEWNTRQHGQSGLVERVKNSQITEIEAEAKTIEVGLWRGVCLNWKIIFITGIWMSAH